VSEPEIKTLRTSLLDIAYEEHGPSTGSVVLLLHGWPDDPRSWDAIVSPLARDGYRVLVPYVRGFGRTRFLSTHTMRSGQYTGIAHDAVDFLTALHISRAIVVGHDWGCRAGYVMAAAWLDRVERLIAISVGYDAIIDPAEVEPAQVR
jgi:pimeloyl-ACP methyl ester carboxylesterase